MKNGKLFCFHKYEDTTSEWVYGSVGKIIGIRVAKRCKKCGRIKFEITYFENKEF